MKTNDETNPYQPSGVEASDSENVASRTRIRTFRWRSIPTAICVAVGIFFSIISFATWSDMAVRTFIKGEWVDAIDIALSALITLIGAVWITAGFCFDKAKYEFAVIGCYVAVFMTLLTLCFWMPSIG